LKRTQNLCSINIDSQRYKTPKQSISCNFYDILTRRELKIIMKPLPILELKNKILFFFIFFFLFLFIYTGTVFSNEKKITNSIGMEFILVQPGTFIMGSPKDEPYRDKNETQHKVTIPTAFYLMTTEVTVKQWRAVMGRKLLSKKKGGDNFPVTRVSFYNAKKFIRKLNKQNKGIYRLPTEAEWEYACRAGTKTAYSWGDRIDCSKAMYENNSKTSPECINYYKSKGILPNQPAPVKSFKANLWGLYDMHGNVWEWCSDTYKEYNNDIDSSVYDIMQTETRVRRGGSWYKYGISLRSANRAYAHPGAKFRTTGFRLVLKAD
jgi:sulfatase modifying factor 1